VRRISDFARACWSACLAILFILHVVTGSLAWFTPNFAGSIASSEITPEQGAAYLAAVHFDGHFPYALPADTNETPYDSGLALYENGRVLGPQHALHADIRKYGGGRYSHWHDSIIFSSSDGSDPRANGRHYSIASTTKLSFPLRIIFLSALLPADAALFSLFREKILVFLRTKAAWRNCRLEIHMRLGSLLTYDAPAQAPGCSWLASQYSARSLWLKPCKSAYPIRASTRTTPGFSRS
jgi:hypothetical protein